ncbi:MAG TPA: thiolase family protein, partial [Xanthobacteraceae bacterium]
AAATAFAMAGVGPADIDVAQLYDCYTIVPLMTLEDYGFCRRGEAGRLAAEGGLALGGRWPLNTSGGLLSETGMPGMQLIIEAVRQMRGTSVNQVRGARTAIVSNQGGIMHTHATLILAQ